MIKKIAILKRKKAIRNLITLLAVITSALLQTFVIQSMIVLLICYLVDLPALQS